MTIGILSFIYC